MSQGRITRIVYWNESAEGWYDVETDVHVKNMRDAHNYAPSQSKTVADWKAIESLIDARLEARTVKTNHYFSSDPSKLATYGYVREVIARTDADVEYLRARVERLGRPWWKRWFSR